ILAADIAWSCVDSRLSAVDDAFQPVVSQSQIFERLWCLRTFTQPPDMLCDELGRMSDLGIFDVPADDGAGFVLAFSWCADGPDRWIWNRRHDHTALLQDESRPGRDRVVDRIGNFRCAGVEHHRLHDNARLSVRPVL